MTDDKEWRKFMDKNWQDLKNNQVNEPLTLDILSPSHDYFKQLGKPTKSIANTKERIKKYDQRQVVKPKITNKHVNKLMKKVVNKQSDIATMGARRKEIASKINPSDAETREHLELTKKMEKTLTERQKQMEKDWSMS